LALLFRTAFAARVRQQEVLLCARDVRAGTLDGIGCDEMESMPRSASHASGVISRTTAMAMASIRPRSGAEKAMAEASSSTTKLVRQSPYNGTVSSSQTLCTEPRIVVTEAFPGGW
jgi:hypothetical protein